MFLQSTIGRLKLDLLEPISPNFSTLRRYVFVTAYLHSEQSRPAVWNQTNYKKSHPWNRTNREHWAVENKLFLRFFLVLAGRLRFFCIFQRESNIGHVLLWWNVGFLVVLKSVRFSLLISNKAKIEHYNLRYSNGTGGRANFEREACFGTFTLSTLELTVSLSQQ